MEWVAHHRAIGVDDVLICTNGCEDGTDAPGVVRHRTEGAWQGDALQQHALDRARKAGRARRGVAHAHRRRRVRERALRRRHARRLSRARAGGDQRRHDLAALRALGRRAARGSRRDRAGHPLRFCPKPHTVWGFKTLFRNIGACGRMSCHGPDKRARGVEDSVRRVNGSGADITAEVAQSGWRSSQRSVGYDLLQLDHAALRSAESFLVKRQRGRALHVDRQIGLNDWIRMDWSDATDLTIQRNLPRLRAEAGRLMADPKVARLHAAGLDWHRERAAALRATPEFRALYEQALATRLTGAERAAWSLALDTES
jgi:hypothetical protein